MEVVVLKTKAASLERDAISKLKLDLHAFKINPLVEGLLTEGDEVQGMVHHFSSPAKKNPYILNSENTILTIFTTRKGKFQLGYVF